MNPACYIFAGYILFGESFNRGKFLVRLQKEYRERAFRPEMNWPTTWQSCLDLWGSLIPTNTRLNC